MFNDDTRESIIYSNESTFVRIICNEFDLIYSGKKFDTKLKKVLELKEFHVKRCCIMFGLMC